ncbi:MAG: ChrR family anti-sigma-E factor [Alphaproteobacteria bacterium]|jgi:putative transcriptional regulator
MTVQFHLSEAFLLDYAAGGLAEGWGLAAATHLALCPDCRAHADGLDAIGGAALAALEPSTVSDDALAQCLARVDALPSQAVDAAPVLGNGLNVLPGPLLGFTGGDVDTVQWRWVGAGIRQHVLPVSGTATARLLRIPAGASAPEHGHHGAEMTIVLGGSFEDGDDIYRRGDVQEADSQTEHSPMAGSDAACVCLMVTDAPLKFRGFGPRLAQRFNRL